MSNFIMAALWSVCLKITSMLHPDTSYVALFFYLSAQAGILINLILAFLNLIPIPPLDGSRVITSLLPPRQAAIYLKIEPFGFYIIIALLFTGALSWFLSPLLSWSVGLIYTLFKL
jgi:Zn-dependent protease